MRNGKCSKFTHLARWLTVLKLFILLICDIPSFTEGRSVSNPCSDSDATNGYPDDICVKPECIHSASAILKNMDPTVDPCDDFYRYACGGFINETIIPDSRNVLDSFSSVSQNLYDQLRLIMQGKIEPNEPRHTRLVKNLYKNCMNKTAIEAAGLKPLHVQLDRLGEWPVVLGDNWTEDNFDWRNAIYKFRNAGLSHNILIPVHVGTDAKNRTKRVIYLTQPVAGYLGGGADSIILDAYYEFMIDIAVMLGADGKRARAELLDLLIFELDLHQIKLGSDKQRNATQLYNRMTLKELSIMYPSTPWKEYLSRLLPSSITIGDDEVVIVNVLSYIAQLEDLLKATPKRIQANYLTWLAITDLLPHLNDAIRSRLQMFFSVFTGNTERKTRSQECTKTVLDFLPLASSAMYVRKYFNQEAKRNTAEMLTNIRQQYSLTLSQIGWMDEKTRMKALDKLNTMVNHTAYPDELFDPEKMDEFYKKLELSGDNYFESLLNLTLFNTEKSLGNLHEPVNKTDWISHGKAATVNAFYTAAENSIQLPAGILQGVFFNNDRPKYINYGAIGFVIAHELTHGFDDVGKQFDKDGHLINWWAPLTDKEYLQRAQCIIEQYGNYTVRELNRTINGIVTQGENIADNGGVKIAYLAYDNWVSKNKPEKKLPGIDKNPKQLFWLSVANTWCRKIRPESLLSELRGDSHSPAEFRIIGSFSNSLEFARDFECPEGSRMNPKKKCQIW